MTIDITNPERREALAWACKNQEWVPEQYIGSDKYNAHFALKDPAQAAELIRALVERAGCDVCKVWAHDMRAGDDRGGQWVMVSAPDLYRAFTMPKIPALVACLLALPPNAGVEAVIAVLRGET